MQEKINKKKDPKLEVEYFEEIELTDPITGKVFKQKVLIKRYKPIADKLVGMKGLMEELEDLDESFQINDDD